jgi:hypothetical protein
MLLLSEVLGSKFASSGNFEIWYWRENTNSNDCLGKAYVLQERKINLYGLSIFVYGYRVHFTYVKHPIFTRVLLKIKCLEEITKQVGVTVTLLTHNREVLGSNLGISSSIPTVDCCALLSPSSNIPG